VVDSSGAYLFILFEQSGRIYNSLRTNNACVISQGGATSSHPVVGSDLNDGFATWQDSRAGNLEVYTCRFWSCTNRTGDIRLTEDPGRSEYPDIGVDRVGSGNWVVVWQDDRAGNREVYLTSRVLAATGSIRGHVVDLVTTRPVRGATVSASLGSGAVGSALSDENGEYLIAPLPAGVYSVHLSRWTHRPSGFRPPYPLQRGWS
jgi:hypothetical protein